MIYSRVGIEITTSAKLYSLAYVPNSAPLLKHTYIMDSSDSVNVFHVLGLNSGLPWLLKSTFSGNVEYAGY